MSILVWREKRPFAFISIFMLKKTAYKLLRFFVLKTFLERELNLSINFKKKTNFFEWPVVDPQ